MAGAARPAMRRRGSPRRGARLTSDGAILLGLAVLLGATAYLSGNNILILLFGALLASALLDAWLGAWNLRHIEVRRELPADLFADTPAPGALHLHNHRRWLPSAALVVHDLGGGAIGQVPRVDPGAEVAVRASWRFAARGTANLPGVQLRSRFPLGLWERWRELPLPADVIVYPRPSGSEARHNGEAHAGHGATAGGSGALGDLVGLAEYRDGDPPSRLHWPTSARLGQPMIVERADEVADQVTVRVRPLSGPAFERELARACGEVLRASRRGDRIALILGEERSAARSGPAWRRELLRRLAVAPSPEHG